jgi:hypothetical protein
MTSSVSLLKGDGPVKEESGKIIFKKLPVTAEVDILRRGIEIAFEDIQQIGEDLLRKAVVGHVGEYEWRSDD